MSQQPTRRELDKSFDALLADATLHRVFAAEDAPFNNGVEIWELRARDTFAQIVFRYGTQPSARQTVVTGDFVGNNNGWVSALGYTIPWFARRQSADYLCSKFIRKTWVPERAADQLLDMALDALREIDEWVAEFSDPADADREAAWLGNERFRALDEALACWEDAPGDVGGVCRSADDFCRFLVDELDEDDAYDLVYVGYGYDPDEAARLCAIQRRFAELYPSHAAD